MMNAVGLVLLVCSLAGAGVWSPPPERGRAPPATNGGVLVKEGHRVIVVEYEREGLRPSALSHQEGSASVQRAIEEPKSIDDTVRQKETEGFTEEVKEKLKEAASVLPKVREGLSSVGEADSKQAETKQGSKICDAFGVCKEKISDMFSAAKNKVADVHEKLSGKASDMEASAKEAARKAEHSGEFLADKVKEAGQKQVEDIVGKGKKVKDNADNAVADGAKKIGHGVSETSQEVAQGAKEKAQNAYGHAEEKVQEVKEKAQDAYIHARDKVQKAKEKAQNAYGRAEEKVQEVKEKARKAGEKVEEATKTAKDAVEEGRRNLTEILHRGRDVVYDATMYAIAPETVGSLMWLLHSLAFSVVYGTCFWVTFVSSHVLARALPRQQFGVVQSKIYPAYFRLVTYGIGICLFTQYLVRRWLSARRGDELQAYNLLLSLGFVVVNMLYIEPRATKVLYDRLKLEKEEGRGRDIDDIDQVEPTVTAGAVDSAATRNAAADGTTTTATATTTTTTVRRVDSEQEAAKYRLVKMNRRLKNLNSYSSLLNMMSLMGLTWHLVYLSQGQQLTC